MHGLCSLLRAAITEQADDKIAEIVASLKAAFDLDYMVRKHLYGQLAILFRDLRSLDLVRHGESAQLSYLQQRVLSRFVAFANKQVHAEGAVCISGSSKRALIEMHGGHPKPLAARSPPRMASRS